MKNVNLITQRKKRKLTQEQTAKAAGISYRQYQNIEAGVNAPSVETAISIARALGSSVSDLFEKNN